MKPLTGCSKSADTDKIQGNQPMKGGTPVRTLYMRDHATDRQPATVIHDENNQAAYLLAGKWGLRQDALSLYNMCGDLLAEVSQLSLGLLPKFALYVNHQKVGVVGKSLGFVREVVYIRGLNWVIVGNALTNHYRVFKGSHQVFAMEPAAETGASFLAITINHPQDEPLAILVACVLNHSHCAANSSGAPKLNQACQCARPSVTVTGKNYTNLNNGDFSNLEKSPLFG